MNFNKKQSLQVLSGLLFEITDAITFLSMYDESNHDDKKLCGSMYTCTRAEMLLKAMEMLKLIDKADNLKVEDYE